MSFFDCPKISIILRAIELKEKGLLPTKSYYDIALDIRALIYRNYVHFNEKEVKDIRTYGRYFPEIVKNPNKYI